MNEKKTGMQNGSQMRITPIEMTILKNAFKGNEELLRLMRKLFLPEMDAYSPLGQNIDLWMTIPLENLTNEQIVTNLKARNMLIGHVDQMLLQIRTLAEMAEDNPEKAIERMKNSSTK